MKSLGVGGVEDRVWREQAGTRMTARLLYTEPGKGGNYQSGLNLSGLRISSGFRFLRQRTNDPGPP